MQVNILDCELAKTYEQFRLFEAGGFFLVYAWACDVAKSGPNFIYTDSVPFSFKIHPLDPAEDANTIAHELVHVRQKQLQQSPRDEASEEFDAYTRASEVGGACNSSDAPIGESGSESGAEIDGKLVLDPHSGDGGSSSDDPTSDSGAPSSDAGSVSSSDGGGGSE